MAVNFQLWGRKTALLEAESMFFQWRDIQRILMILHQQGPSYVLFNLAGNPVPESVGIDCWLGIFARLTLWKPFWLLLELGAVPLSSDKRLPYPGLPGNCRLLSWDSRRICVVSAELGKLSQTSAYSFPLALYGSWPLSYYWGENKCMHVAALQQSRRRGGSLESGSRQQSTDST